MSIAIELNEIQRELLLELRSRGIYGQDVEGVILRIIDERLAALIIDGVLFRKPSQ